MSRPFFSIAIPTKNRPDRLADAVKSVLNQSFSDFEIIVCDNGDEKGADLTAAAVREFDDSRIRYIRTSGQLSMPDNWETAIADARGEFVSILTDRSVFHRYSLQVVHSEIQKTDARLVSWAVDHYGRGPEGTGFRPRKTTLRRHRLESETVLDYFLRGDPKYAPKIIPRLMNAACHRSILDTIRASPAGRCCPPVCPDYTSGFLMLAHCDWMLWLDQALYVSCGLGNGFEFRKRGELADVFMRDLGMTWDDLVDRMPSTACFSHALILNDFMRVRDMLPDRFAGREIDKAQYYLGCLNDCVKAARSYADRAEDLALLLDSLGKETKKVQKKVRSKRLYARAVSPAPALQENAETTEDSDPGAEDSFASVFDALAWNEANPPPPVPHTFLDLMPTAENLPRVKKTRKKKARVAPSKGAAAIIRTCSKAAARAKSGLRSALPVRWSAYLSEAWPKHRWPRAR